MDENTLLLARLLGETYRMQKSMSVPVPVDDSTIYGLLHGIQEAVDDVLRGRCYDNARVGAATAVLAQFDTEEALANFNGFYDLEPAWSRAGLDRSDAIALFPYFLSAGRFVELIRKMDSSSSPMECKTFPLEPYDT